MNIYSYKDVKQDIKYVKVDHWNSEENAYDVYFKGKLIGKVESTTRTSYDIPNSVFRRDIKGVREWGGDSVNGRTYGRWYQSRQSVVMQMLDDMEVEK